jgi:glycosyltransferase involved in cell wall biosynthesis
VIAESKPALTRRSVGSRLEVTLETKLPQALPAERGGALFVYGTCRRGDEPLRGLQVLRDGDAQPTSGWRERQGGWGTRFWSVVPIPPRGSSGSAELALAAQTGAGVRVTALLGTVELTASPPAPTVPAPKRADDLIAICLATFEPDIELFRAQIESLRAQTEERWVCVVSDDCSDPASFDALRSVLDGDERFQVSRSTERLGFYRNFERALALVPPGAGLVALCDQDDRWHPDKLAALRGALGSAQLAYSDQRLVDARGRVLQDTLWRGRRNNYTDLGSLLLANTITGAAMLFRREVAERALPFPDPPGWQFHDHWIGLVALAGGEIAYVDRPLYDYVQHEGAILGHVGRRDRERRPAWGIATRWRAAYFYGYLGRVVTAHALVARCPEIDATKRRALTGVIAAERSPRLFAWLGLRGLRRLAGASSTLGAELQLALGIVWRRLAAASRADAALPPLASFEQRRLRRWRARL